MAPPSRSPAGSTVAGLLLAAALLAVAKPWAGLAPPAPPSGRPSSAVESGPGPLPAPTPTSDPDQALVSSFCLEPAGWRLFATERFANRTVRIWKSMDPPVARATGPGDPAIPFVFEASGSVMNLGYCVPIRGPETPRAETQTRIYRLDGALWTPVVAPQELPRAGASRLGGAWGPPTGPDASGVGPATLSAAGGGWSSGTYVFRVTGEETLGEAPFERWFGVVLEILPPRAPGAQPPASPAG